MKNAFLPRAIQQKGQLRHPLEVYQERLAREIADHQADAVPGLLLDCLGFHPLCPTKSDTGGAWERLCCREPGFLLPEDHGYRSIQYGLLFERFLNPERISMPDIDIDFCTNRRGEVINYVTHKYGRENVSQIITFGTMAAKAAIKDAGRALDMPYAEVDELPSSFQPN